MNENEKMNDPNANENSIEENETFETFRAAALVGKASFPDQIDYYDPERDEII